MKNKKNKINKAWNFTTPEEGVAEVTIYGNISDKVDWESGDINPEFFSSDLAWLEDENINTLIIRINSAGGDVFAATAIYSRLKEFKAKKIVKIDGWAASAATIIAMAGDEIEIAPNGSLMIHDPLFGLEGYFNAKDLTKYIEQLETIKKSIINAYKTKTGKTEEELAQLMEAETWYTGQEAVDAGFCDRLMFEEADVAASANGDIKVNGILMVSDFKNLPITVLNRSQNHATGNDFNINTKNRKEVRAMDENKETTTTTETETKEIKTVEELKEAYPELVKEIEEEAKKEELERLQAIEEIAAPGAEEIVNDAKYKTKITAGEVAIKILNAQKAKGQNFIQEREKDVKNSGMGDVEGSQGQRTEDKNEFLDAINKAYPKAK
ncbi:head maturation protease, ClpP-related [Anaerococcus vaginalis]|uniref:head maturation protease, ClpP-related n=1 Tax=Anaerococcus vaginalis TaxID=33037 RepID=UPI0029133834|nr:head maturation protease, ClpP-related [Anaerococcus vaginalis]MDU6546239.1 Clp protease ClpP [Anaerococcus vaginalis]MDU7141353.1 Clp protease ClpP [Anaerococcus vaginalis]